MSPNLPTLPATANSLPADPDLLEQAKPGHGIPSQDTAAAAQFPLNAEEAEREAKSALMGGGVVAGAAAGASIGVVIAGPVGVLVGGTVGAVVGAMGASAAGVALNADSPDHGVGPATAALPVPPR